MMHIANFVQFLGTAPCTESLATGSSPCTLLKTHRGGHFYVHALPKDAIGRSLLPFALRILRDQRHQRRGAWKKLRAAIVGRIVLLARPLHAMKIGVSLSTVQMRCKTADTIEEQCRMARGELAWRFPWASTARTRTGYQTNAIFSNKGSGL
jgi:hypothetical protein